MITWADPGRMRPCPTRSYQFSRSLVGGLQLAEAWQMDGKVAPELLAASEWAFQEALEEISRAAEQHWRVDGGPGQCTDSGTCGSSFV